ncbi:hypothetical protein, partial [Antarctobacter heliothermus]|uniref:hypothetical protein n=1 Tax=Antarctobacter heliothermus TaxID=74033 RepID=UPI001BB03E82
ARRDRSAHAGQLPRWIHEMNPSTSLCATKPRNITNGWKSLKRTTVRGGTVPDAELQAALAMAALPQRSA